MPAPYIPDVNNTAEPIIGRPAGTAAAEFRGIKTLLATLAVAGLASSSVRQAIQSASLDANGQNNAITVGAGLRPGLLATANPYHLSYATGFTQGKPSNLDEVIALDNADILAANLPLSNTSYLYKIWAGAYGSTLIPRQEGYTFDRTKQALLNFEGINGSVVTTDDFGNVWTLAGSAISTAQFKFGTSSIDCTGGGAKSVSTLNITTLGDGSWQAECWFRLAALPAVAGRALIFEGCNAAFFGALVLLFNNAGITKLELNLSSNGTASDIAAAVVGVNTVWTLNQWNKVRLAFDALSGTYKLYLSLNGAVETVDISIASAARICAITKLYIGTRSDGTLASNAWFDAFRLLPCVTNTSVEVPAVVAPILTDYLISFFNIPQMKMYDVTAASVISGVNPTLTAVNRLFLGEADTSGIAVTAVRNYAVRGEFYGEQAALIVTTAFTFNDNIGTKLKNIQAWIECMTSEFGWKVGDRLPTWWDGNSGTGNSLSGQTVDIQSRNTARFCVHTPLSIPSNTNLAQLVGATIGNWKAIVHIRRNF